MSKDYGIYLMLGNSKPGPYLLGPWSLPWFSFRNAIFMSHVPWLGALFLRMPDFFAKDLKAFRSHAQKRAIMRKKQGSPHKDLFHYLVGPRIHAKASLLILIFQIDEDGVATNPPSVVEVVSDGILSPSLRAVLGY